MADGWYDSDREFRFQHGDGTPFNVFLQGESVSHGDDACFLFLVTFHGSSARSVSRLEERNWHLNRAQRLARTGSWEWDIVTNGVHWSDEIFRIFGLTPRAFGASYPAFLETIHPDDRAMVEESVRRAVDDGEDYDIDHRIVLPTGEIRFVRERGEVEFSADGQPLRMLGAIQDITELRLAESAAARSRDMLSSMLRISPEAVIVSDAEGRILLFSAGAEAVFGYRAEEIVGESIERLIPERHRAAHGRHFEEFSVGRIDSLQMGQRGPIAGLRKSGEEFPIEASLARIETGEGLAFTTIVHDITERFESEARLIFARDQAQEANRAKSTFLANMSHELRTPLNGMLGVASALARTEVDPRQREMVELIETSGRALQGLLADILDLAQVEAGRLEINSETFDLGAMARDIFSLLGASARDKGLDFKLMMADEACHVFRGDEMRIRQVLSNLLSNAVKFTERGSVELVVDAPVWRSDAFWARFIVQDTGIGFDDDVMSRLFGRFEQADSSITRRFGGTGLGLAICKSLVELMGGRIEARSTPGRGSTFTFEVPLAAASEHVDREPSSRPEMDVTGRPARILLAEDHPINRRVVEMILDPLGVNMTSVENGEKAVTAAASELFDLILMDMQMPVMDGLEAVRRIREQERGEGRSRTPICMLTANALPEHRLMSAEAGADDFLTKPVSATALIGMVVTAVEQAERRPDPTSS